jgi:hypothetical protein
LDEEELKLEDIETKIRTINNLMMKEIQKKEMEKVKLHEKKSKVLRELFKLTKDKVEIREIIEGRKASKE